MGFALLPSLVSMGMHNNNNNNKGSSTNSGTGGQAADSSPDSDDWGEESWIVDCPCGVTFDDGEEMVECDECGVWVHTSCCQVSIKLISTYVCDKCKEKKMKEREESEVAQLLVELPGKTVSFEDKSCERSDVLLGHGNEMAIERKVHEHGVPGGDPAIFVGVSSVFSQQLWKCAGYVPKLLQVQYMEIPNWAYDAKAEATSLFDLPKQQVKDSPPKGVKKPKHEPDVKVSNADGDVQRLKLHAPDDDGARKDKHGKRMEVIRHSKHKHKYSGLADGKSHSHGKRNKEDVKEQYSRKKMKTSPDAVKDKKSHAQPSPKNPKAMKKNAVQEFMDVDSRVCSRCLRSEPVTDDDQGSLSKTFVCQECQKSRHSLRKQENRAETEGPTSDQSKKCNSQTLTLSPETASTELPKQSEQKMQCVELTSGLETKSSDGEHSKQKLHSVMKPPSDDCKRTSASNEDRPPKIAQDSMRLTTFSDIPSPASINSGGTAAAKLSPNSPTNQKPTFPKAPPVPAAKPSGTMSKSVLLKSASAKSLGPTKQPTGVPTFRKSDTTAKTGEVSKDSKTPLSGAKAASQHGILKQLTPCKTSVCHSSKSAPGPHLPKKPTSSGTSKTGKDACDKPKEESLLHKASVSSASASQSAPLNDEELALLLHQELNSSPRVPRVPRVRQAIASASVQPSGKRPAASAAQKEHRLMWRKRHRAESKEGCRGDDATKFEETPLMTATNRKHDEGAKTDDDATDSGESEDVGSITDRGTQQNEAASKKRPSPSSDVDETYED